MSKKIIILMAIILVMLNFTVLAYGQNKSNDIKEHWAEKILVKWIDNGLMHGLPDGTIRPDSKISKVEFIALVNRIYGFYEEAETNYTDILENDWFKKDTAIAKANGFMNWYKDDKLFPRNEISRQEVCSILYSVMQLEELEDMTLIENFSDSGSISDWSKGYVAAVIANGYISGYPDKTLRVQNGISRAEAIAMLDKVMGELVNTAGTYGTKEERETIKGNLTINIGDVVLQNKVIEGDLILAAGIGEENVYLDNVKVEGRTIINGGGENSIIIKNSNMDEIIVLKINGKIRIVSNGSKIGKVLQKSGGKLEGKFERASVQILAQGQEVELEGDFDELIVKTKAEIEITGDTKVGEIEIAKKGKGTKIDVSKDGVIREVTFNGQGEVTGHGRIIKATLNVAGVNIKQKVEEKKLAKGINGSGVKEKSKSGSSSTPDKTAPSGYNVKINHNYINNSNKNDFSFTFSEAERNATYNYSIDDTKAGTTAITGSGTITDAAQTISGIDVSTLDDDTLTLTVSLTDTSGNKGSDVKDTVEKDTIAPKIPTVSGISAGSYNIDQSFTVTGESGTTLKYSINNGTKWDEYSSEVTLSEEGTYKLIGRQTDVAGNHSTSGTIIVTIDKTAPSAPTVSEISAGIYNTDQSFKVTGELGATLDYSLDNGAKWDEYSSEVTLTAEGTYELIARQTDAAGNQSLSSSIIEVTIDKTAPTMPTVNGISAGSYNTDQSFTVTGESGATLHYSLDNGAKWDEYSSEVTLSEEGTYKLIGRQTDVAGNHSTSSTITVTIDKTSPSAPTVSEISAGIYNTDQSFKVTGELGATLDYSLDNGAKWDEYSSEVTLIAEGTYELIARQTDAAGNQSLSSIIIEVTIDKTAPTMPTVNGILAGSYNTDQSFTVNGETGELGATLDYSLDNGAKWDEYSSEVTLSAEGTYELIARQTDVAGNHSSNSSLIIVTIDKTEPSLSNITPSDGEEKVAVNSDIVIVFNESLDDTVKTGWTVSCSIGSFSLTQANASISYSTRTNTNDTVTINPDSDLSNDTTYSDVTIDGFKDLAGNTVSGYNDVAYNFDTEADKPTVTKVNVYHEQWYKTNQLSGDYIFDKNDNSGDIVDGYFKGKPSYKKESGEDDARIIWNESKNRWELYSNYSSSDSGNDLGGTKTLMASCDLNNDVPPACTWTDENYPFPVGGSKITISHK